MSTILDLDAPEVRRLIRVFSIGDTDMAGAELPDDFTDLVLRALLFSALANRAACLQFVNEHERDQLWFYAYVRIPKEHAQAECGGRKVPVYETPDGLRWVRFDFVPLPSNAAEDIFACLREYSGTSPFDLPPFYVPPVMRVTV